jgi:uroporphyrinogen decarboxylase
MKKREFLKSGLYAAGGFGLLGSSSVLNAAAKPAPPSAPVYVQGSKVNKRDKLFAVLDQSKPNKYIPAAFFMHFEEKLGQGAIDRHLAYFRATDMDFVKIQYEVVLPRLSDIKKPEDWAKVPVYGKDFFKPQLEVIAALTKELKAEALVLPTVYSPYSLANQTAGHDTFIAHAKENPDAVVKGLQNITESILNYVHEAIELGVDGFYISTQGGETKNFGDGPLFDKLIAPFDKAVLQESSDKALLNILHICDYSATYKQLDKFRSYPASIINPPIVLDNEVPVKLKDVQAAFGRPVFGGLNRLGVISKGTSEEIKNEVDRILKEASPNFILGADCTVASNTPWQTLRTAIDYAHDWRLTNG